MLREMLQRVAVRKADLIWPIFVVEGSKQIIEVSSMPDVYQMSVDVAVARLSELARDGLRAFIVFGVIDRDKKDATGSPALDENNVVCQLLREVKKAKLPLVAISDLCLCEYTSHGHCGVISNDHSSIDNDRTLPLLAQQAVNHARAGADVIAPSGKMDGAVGAVRRALDEHHFIDTAILSYSVKYASGFYGPFRHAADSTPMFGDRRAYQMDFARGEEEAVHAAQMDVDQGADMVMVKPAGAYLDIIYRVSSSFALPVLGYQVSGEYAMIKAASQNGWLDGDAAMLESLIAIKRAGARAILTYAALDVAKQLQS